MVAVVLFVVGIALASSGYRGRRTRDLIPYCRACEYNLTALDSDRCPECGAALSSETTVYGKLRRSPAKVVVGLVLLFLGGAGMLAEVRGRVWYPYYPTFWLLREFESQPGGRLGNSWFQLIERYDKGALSPSQQATLLKLSLDKNTVGHKIDDQTGNIISYLDTIFANGGMTAEQEIQFMRTFVDMDLEVRSQVMLHEDARFKLSARCRSSRRGDFWITIDSAPVLVNGAPTGLKTKPITTGGLDDRSVWDVIPAGSIGSHELTMTLTIMLYEGQRYKVDNSRLCLEMAVPLSTKFDVAEKDRVTMIDDPILRDLLLKELRPNIRTWGGVNRTTTELILDLGVLHLQVPIDIAGTVSVRDGDNELHSGEFLLSKSWSSGTSLYAKWNGPPPSTLDIVFRASADVAKKSLSIFEIWNGELVWRDVPVRR